MTPASTLVVTIFLTHPLSPQQQLRFADWIATQAAAVEPGSTTHLTFTVVDGEAAPRV